MSNFALSNSTVGRAAVLTSPPAISRNAASVLPIARRGSVRQSVRVGPAVGAFLAALATTLYVTLVDWDGIALRPVQLIPMLLLPCALLTPRMLARARGVPLRGLAMLWAAYMTGRFLFLPPTDTLTAVRALTCAAAFFTVLEFSLCQERPNAALVGFATGCLISTVAAGLDISILDKVPRYHGNARWSGMMPDPNRFADLSGLAFVLSFANVMHSKSSLQRCGWAGSLLLCGAGLLGSGSRGGLLAAAVATMGTIWISNKACNRRMQLASYMKPLILLGILVGATFYFFGDRLSERVLEFVSFSDAGRDNVENDPRREIAAAAREKFASSPLIGGGSEYVSLDGNEIASHNSYLFLLSTSGVIGFALYGGLVGTLVYRLKGTLQRRALPAAAKALVVPALGGIVFLAVHMCVIDLILSAHAWAFFGFASAIAIRTAAIGERIPSERLRRCA